MEEGKPKLTKDQIIALKSRWNDKDPQSNETVLKRTIQQLKTECKKDNVKRPLSFDLRGITLVNEDLTELDFSGYDFSWANLNQSNLKGTNLSYTKLIQTSLEQAILDECEFMGSDLTEADLNECTAIRCGFGGADLSFSSIINADLSHASFIRSKMVGADLRASNLKNAKLSEMDLTDAIFTRAILVKSDLKHSNVKGTTFELADMQGCRLLGIKNYKEAMWIGADIRDLDLRGAYQVRRFISDENYLYEFQTGSGAHRILYLLWKATSDCGRSLFRWFIFLTVATLLFAAVYTQVDIDYGDHATVFSPVYFSFITLTTVGYGDAAPASLVAQIFVTLQAITGYMGLGGLLSILGNKMARRAE
ncbi:MAG: hypothetical protein GY857_15905 [Desulfobacula sp.]|nr:hypothetical protein [Desulfobacula sp.]